MEHRAAASNYRQRPGPNAGESAAEVARKLAEQAAEEAAAAAAAATALAGAASPTSTAYCQVLAPSDQLRQREVAATRPNEFAAESLAPSSKMRVGECLVGHMETARGKPEAVEVRGMVGRATRSSRAGSATQDSR